MKRLAWILAALVAGGPEGPVCEGSYAYHTGLRIG